jgi:hypothetical protein
MSPVVYYDRMWCLGGTNHNTLFWSDIANPNSWSKDSNYADIYADDGDFGTCLVRDFNGLIVFKSDHMYRLAGRTPSDMVLSELTLADGKDVTLGCPHVNAMVATPDGLFFYWKGGVYRYRAGRVKNISEDIDPTLNRIRADHEDQIYMGYWPNERLLFASFGRDNFDTGREATFGVTYIYNLSEKAWVGRMLGHFGPFANFAYSPQESTATDRTYRNGFMAGGHNHWNAVTSTTNNDLSIYNHSGPLSVFVFDNEEAVGSTDPLEDQRGRQPSAGAKAALKGKPVKEQTGFVTCEFQPFYGEPRERTMMKRFLYVDFVVSDTTADFDIEFDVDEVENVRQVNYSVVGGGNSYTVYRAYLGVIGWKVTARIDFNDENDGQLRVFGGAVGYQPATPIHSAVPPNTKIG